MPLVLSVCFFYYTLEQSLCLSPGCKPDFFSQKMFLFCLVHLNETPLNVLSGAFVSICEAPLTGLSYCFYLSLLVFRCKKISTQTH